VTLGRGIFFGLITPIAKRMFLDALGGLIRFFFWGGRLGADMKRCEQNVLHVLLSSFDPFFVVGQSAHATPFQSSKSQWFS